jgi:hypothetical protein
MVSRFVARRQNDREFCVWDNQTGAVAQTVNSQTRYQNLGFDQAIDAAMELNGPDRAADPLSASDQKPSKNQ